MIIPGGFQHVATTPSRLPLSAETIAQQQFPYHTFVVVDTRTWTVERQHTLVINPQEYAMREPTRSQVVQTIGGAYVDDFGRGLPTVTISGNTGWRLKPVPDTQALMDGWQAFKALRNDIYRFYTDAKDEVITFQRSPYYQLRWYNWAEDEYYVIHPEEFQLQRSASKPLLYMYTFSFTCLVNMKENLQKGYKLSVWRGDSANTTALRNSFVAESISANTKNLSALAKSMRGD